MLVCDCCHSTDQKKRKAFEISLTTIKDEEKSKKIVPREMLRIPMHLCDKCIDHFHSRLGVMIATMRNSPPCEVEIAKQVEEEYKKVTGFEPVVNATVDEAAFLRP